VWDCQHKFRIVIGPVAYADYQRFLPGGASMRRLLAWVKNYVGVTLDWDVRVILKKEEMPPLRLGGATRMGWSTWLTSTKPTRNPDQMLINPVLIESSESSTREPAAASRY
jgi:type VI secretion system protein ImpH